LVGSQIPINHYLSGKNVFSIKRLEEGTHLLYPYLGPISVDIPDIVEFENCLHICRWAGIIDRTNNSELCSVLFDIIHFTQGSSYLKDCR
ncbi:MAG: hypothetical protein ACRD5B_15460, partial [Nitrososphaeraceae archaeon]